jgi:hypothetical protein
VEPDVGVEEEPGAESAGGDCDEAGRESRGGSSPEPEPVLEPDDGADEPAEDGAEGDGEDDGVEDDGAEEGAEAGTVLAPGFLVNRGGASELSIPTGVVSACNAFFLVSDPAGTYAPVASQGTDALAALLCNAAPMVNRPSELPVRSAS